MRRDFNPYYEDLEFLASRETPWEAVREESQCWYILHDYSPPKGYAPEKVSAAFCLPGTYPSTQIDMVYFFPSVSRLDGRESECVSNQSFDGKQWQQWSRHRLNANDWKDGVDYLATHIHFIELKMLSEVGEEAVA